jgi:4-amino-4-deoxy-L-arabinose transferase-like glycosyltransferase
MLGAFPLMDPTESRYAEIARQMFALGDWVTPWIAPGEPFWGKPPFSFWMSAASFQLFGVSDFAARLPHWIGGLLVAWLTWQWLSLRSRREAALGAALLIGSLLFFVAAGAVMTDMALAIGLMAVMRGYWLALHGPEARRRREQVLMFAGIAVALLAKGPIALMAVVPMAVHAWPASCPGTSPPKCGRRASSSTSSSASTGCASSIPAGRATCTGMRMRFRAGRSGRSRSSHSCRGRS